MAPTGVLQSPIFFAYGGEEFRRIRPIEGGSEGWGCIVIDGVVLPRGEALVKTAASRSAAGAICLDSTKNNPHAPMTRSGDKSVSQKRYERSRHHCCNRGWNRSPSPRRDSIRRRISCHSGQRDGAQYACIAAQGGRHDVIGYPLQNFGRLDVAVQQRQNLAANAGEQVRLPHHAAAQNNSLGREGTDPGGQAQGDVVSLQVPGGMLGRERLAALAPAGFER